MRDFWTAVGRSCLESSFYNQILERAREEPTTADLAAMQGFLLEDPFDLLLSRLEVLLVHYVFSHHQETIGEIVAMTQARWHETGIVLSFVSDSHRHLCGAVGLAAIDDDYRASLASTAGKLNLEFDDLLEGDAVTGEPRPPKWKVNVLDRTALRQFLSPDVAEELAKFHKASWEQPWTEKVEKILGGCAPGFTIDPRVESYWTLLQQELVVPTQGSLSRLGTLLRLAEVNLSRL